MAYTTVASLDAEKTVALGKKDKATGKPYPKQAEGYYLGNRTVQGARGDSKLHFLQTSEGNLGVWGTTDLDKKLSQVPVGVMTRITSTGTKPTKNGEMYTYKVEQDTANSINVQIEASAPSYDDGGDDYNTAEDGNEDANVGNSYEEENDNDAQAIEAAKRKAKVEELLKGSGNKGKRN